MTRIYSDEAMPDELRGAIAALGNFDGFHLGHQAVAGKAIERARERGVAAIVATFDPHPSLYFKPELKPYYLTTLDQREELFEAAGADAMLVFRFTPEFARISSDTFVRDILVDKLHLGGVVTGEDIAFGRDRSGNIDMLRRLGGEKGLIIDAVPPVLSGGQVVSSSRIRSAVEDARLDEAGSLLTRPFVMRGEVVHGAKEGRRLGFPTANIEMGPYLRPHYGVYAVKARLADGQTYLGAANVGIRPSYAPPVELLEAHLLDFEGDLYGQTIDVEFHHFLRPEQKFHDLDDLVRQMDADCQRARELLSA